jgi:hypothetical protein
MIEVVMHDGIQRVRDFIYIFDDVIWPEWSSPILALPLLNLSTHSYFPQSNICLPILYQYSFMNLRRLYSPTTITKMYSQHVNSSVLDVKAEPACLH